MRLVRCLKPLLVLCLATMSAWAGEYVVLANGFRLYGRSHENAGAMVRLHTNQGDIDIPSSNVKSFEQDDYVPPPEPAKPPGPAPAPAATTSDPHQIVSLAADAAGLPRELVHSVVRAESGYRIDAVSPKGAIGLMQLMPGTAAALSADPNNPRENALAGAMYLRELLLKYQDSDHQVSRAVAAYNAGPGAVDKYNGVPPYRETRNYVRRVISRYNKETGQDAPSTSSSSAPAKPARTD